MTDERHRRRLRRLPGPPGRQGPRPQGPRRRPGADVRPGGRHGPAADRTTRRPLAGRAGLARRAGLRLRASRGSAAARGGRRAGCGRRSGRPSAEHGATLDPGVRPGAGRGGRAAGRERAATFRFPDETWARVVYEAVLAHRHGVVPDEALVAALVPLYFGRVASHVRETAELSGDEAEAVVERQARAFEPVKPEFVGGALGGRARDEVAPACPAASSCRWPTRAPRPTSCASARRSWSTAATLTALGIVEVPEGMPLSEGATRARQARRLLQRVLEFAPDERRAAHHGAHRAPGRRGHRRGRRGGRGGSHHLRLGRAARRARARAAEAVFSPTIDEVVRDAPCDIAVVKQRGVDDVRRILVPVRGGPHAELAIRFADALGRGFGAEVVALHVVPAGAGRLPCGPRRSAPCGPSCVSHTQGPRATAARRGRQRRAHHPPRGGVGTAGGHGRHGPAGLGRRAGAAAGERPLRRPAGDGRAAGAPHGHRGQDEGDADPRRLRRAAPGRPRRSRPRSVRRRSPRACRPGSIAGSPSRTSHQRVRRPAACSWRSRRGRA